MTLPDCFDVLESGKTALPDIENFAIQTSDGGTSVGHVIADGQHGTITVTLSKVILTQTRYPQPGLIDLVSLSCREGRISLPFITQLPLNGERQEIQGIS